jgi:hypothetical protein
MMGLAADWLRLVRVDRVLDYLDARMRLAGRRSNRSDSVA